MARWVGRCPGCGAWGTVREQRVAGGSSSAPAQVGALGSPRSDDRRVGTGLAGVDRVLGGGLVEAGVCLLAGEPGIGKSTLLLQLVSHLAGAGFPCLLASGEESRDQVAARAQRLGVDGDSISFVAGRELGAVLDAARGERPFLLAVDSIQTLRDPEAAQVPGGPAQVRACADALVGLAKSEGIAVLLTGHVTKDGDVAGPRTLEHAVDVVLAFDGDPRSGLRVLSGGKNRFGPDGEVAWFEMTPKGLREIDPAGLLAPGGGEPGACVGLPSAGRRAIAVEVQALVAPTEGPTRRQVTGLDPRRFQLVAAVLSNLDPSLRRADLYGAALGGIRVEDPACDLAVAAALASASSGVAPPPSSAFVGEIGLTGRVRPVAAMGQRLSAAASAGIELVFAPPGTSSRKGIRLVPVEHVSDAVTWASARKRGTRQPARRPA